MKNSRPLYAVTLTTALAVTLAACGGSGVELSSSTPEALAAEAVEEGLVGVIVHTDEMTAVAGVSNSGDQTPMGPRDRFRIASNSKMFLGLIAAILHVDGVVDLDAPITTYLGGEVIERIANADQVTLRQLLNHEAGLYDYLGSDGFWDAVEADPSRRWTDAEALTYAYDERAYFEPGTDWEYSNTNYLLAGLVIDAATGDHHSVAIRERILDPLGMANTWYEHAEDPGLDLVHGYQELRGGDRDTYAYDSGYGMADGGIISTADDLATFMRAIGTRDERLGADAVALLFEDMIDLGDDETYGLGVSLFANGTGELIGHGGNVPGYVSDVFYQVATDRVLVVFSNSSDGWYDEVYGALVERAVEIVFESGL